MKLSTTLFAASLLAVGCSSTRGGAASSQQMVDDYPLNMGNNPLITTMYTADPTARVFDGILYLYPSTDIPDPADYAFNGFCMPGYNVFSSKNLSDWKDHGKIIGQEDIPWARQDKYCMWAPCCIKKGDTYYYYYPSLKADGKGFGVGVATSKSPSGPFKVGAQNIAGVGNIDPNAFIDDDGQAYLYYGGGKGDVIRGAKLKENMSELDGEAVIFKNLPPEYKEATFMFKRNGIYYLTFSHSVGNSELCYATGDNPLGPFEFKGRILDPWKDCWTSHHSIVEYNGQWILFYHHNDISKADKLRSVCADYLTFDDNGEINLVTPTLRGIGNIPANREIQIDRYSAADESKIKIERLGEGFPANWMVSYIQDGAWLRYDRVNFDASTYTKAMVRYSCGVNGGEMLIKDANSGKLLAKFDLGSTGGWNKWQVAEVELQSQPSGMIDIKVEFSGNQKYQYNVDWIKFQ